MPERAALARLLTALVLTLPLLATAQTGQPSLSPAERAQREADRVFSVIKFHTIRSKPAAEAGNRPSRTLSAPAQRPSPQARPAPDAVSAASPTAEAGEPSPGASVAETMPAPAYALPASSAADEPVAATPGMEAEPAAAEFEELPLRMQSFVAPVLSPAVQATLGAGDRHVRVRLTVEPDGRVSQAEAAASVPRRLAKPATEAILQWRFEPLAQARTADVEIAFRRD